MYLFYICWLVFAKNNVILAKVAKMFLNISYNIFIVLVFKFHMVSKKSRSFITAPLGILRFHILAS